jgi:hypothetical protein
MLEKPQLWEARVALPENFSKTRVPTIGMRRECVCSEAAGSSKSRCRAAEERELGVRGWGLEKAGERSQ